MEKNHRWTLGGSGVQMVVGHGKNNYNISQVPGTDSLGTDSLFRDIKVIKQA